MFKSVSNLLHRTPWWALITYALVLLIALIALATPFRVIGLSKEGETAADRRAVQREIDAAFADNALLLGRHVVEQLQSRSADPVRRAELQSALDEIDRARSQYAPADPAVAAPPDPGGPVTEMLLDELQQDVELALDAYAATVDAREGLDEAQRDLSTAFKSNGLPASEWPKSLARRLAEAHRAEAEAQSRVDAARSRLNDARRRFEQQQSAETGRPMRAPPPAPAPPPAAVPPVAPVHPSVAPLAVPELEARAIATPRGGKLSREARERIAAVVAQDFVRVVIGAVLLLLYVFSLIVVIVAKVFIDRARRSQAIAEVMTTEAEENRLRRQLVEARLQTLQAQVEPHFLYNTLANVQALTEVDPPAAGRMIGHLIDYLRAALPRMREHASTVRQEVELARAYLNILKMRMGERLDFSIDVAADAADKPFPPSMLPSLVENAIKHGLEPQRDGGRVDISARVEGDRLVVAVRDTGRGLTDHETLGGVGLANISERLAAMYGDAATLQLVASEPRGVLASIALPLGAPLAAPARVHESPPSALPQGSIAARVAKVFRAINHGWQRVVTFLVGLVLALLVVALLAGIVGALTGQVPVQFDDVVLTGAGGKTLGLLGLFAAFGVAALVAVVLAGLLYAIGYVVATLLIVVPVLVIISLAAPLTPFILAGVLIYWLVRKKRSEGRT